MPINEKLHKLMKAISRLLIIFSLMVSLTGFSFTNADLSQNSDFEYNINPMVDLNSIELVSIADVLQIDYPICLDESLKTEFVKQFKSDIDDVGWQSNISDIVFRQIQNSNIKESPSIEINVRNPRDALRY